MEYSHIKFFYSDLDSALDNKYLISEEKEDYSFSLDDLKYEEYYKAFSIEFETMSNIFSSLNLKYSINMRMKEFEYNRKYKNSKIVFIYQRNYKIGYFEYIHLNNIWYLANVHILKEFRNSYTAKQLFQLIVEELNKTKPEKVFVVCQKINSYIQRLFTNLDFTYLKDLNDFEEIWSIQGELFKENLEKTLGNKRKNKRRLNNERKL